MAVWAKEAVRTKIFLIGKVGIRKWQCNYVGCDVTCELEDHDIGVRPINKINKYQGIYGVIEEIF